MPSLSNQRTSTVPKVPNSSAASRSFFRAMLRSPLAFLISTVDSMAQPCDVLVEESQPSVS
jgi:hypothetical protein